MNHHFSNGPVVTGGVNDLQVANRFRSSEVTDASYDAADQRTDSLNGFLTRRSQLPPNQHVTTNPYKVVLVLCPLVFRATVSLLILFEIRLIMDGSREAHLGKNEDRQFTAESFQRLNQVALASRPGFA